MGYFPGVQKAKTSPRNVGPKRSSGGGGGSSSSSPTPYKTSPGLDPAVNAERMKANLARGVGDSQGRSPSDPNFGKGPTAPRSQFRSTGGGAALKSATLKTRVVSPQEFQRSLAQKQQISRSTRKFLSNIQEQRTKTGAAERRKRIDAVTQKQRLVKEIKGQPLSEIGRQEKQAIIDYIDRQFEPFIGRKKALFTTSTAGKIQKNLDYYMRSKGVKGILEAKAPKQKKGLSSTKTTISAATSRSAELKGIASRVKKGELGGMLEEARGELLWRSVQGSPQSRLEAVGQLAALGAIRGVVDIATALRHPIRTVKMQIEAIKTPITTLKVMGREFEIDPVGTAVQYLVFAKGLNIVGKGVKKSPVGKFVETELYVRSLPKELQGPIRKILKAADVQKAINPFNIKRITKADFLSVKSLSKIEAEALYKTLQNTDSVIFGSLASKILGRSKKLPAPKDVDIATSSVSRFNKSFIDNLPKNIRKNYIVKGEKILRKVSSTSKEARRLSRPVYDPLFDVKPLSRLVPQKSLLTGRGSLPITGVVTKIKGFERINRIVKITKDIRKLTKKINKSRSKSARRSLISRIQGLEKKRAKEIKRLSPSELVELKKKPGIGSLTIPTQKLVSISGFKLVGFGEQTVRKALGTIQVLIERNVRRAKDPAGLVRALEIQRQALKRSKKLTLFKKRKLGILDDTIRMLKSKEFAKLLEKKVPGITKEYPLVGKINVKKLRSVNFKRIEREVIEKIKKSPKAKDKEKEQAKRGASRKRTKFSKSRTPRKARKTSSRSRSRLPRKKVSRSRSTKKSRSESLKRRRPSRLPKSKRAKPSRLSKTRKSKRSRIPSKLKRSRPSKLRASKPSRFRSKKGRSSKLAKAKPSKIAPSKLKPTKPSKLRPSKLKPSRLRPPSRIPPSGVSRLTASRIRSALKSLPKGTPTPPRNILKRARTKKDEARVIRWVKQQKQIYRPSLAAVLFNITGIPKGKLTGFEIRPILVRRKIARKKPKRIKRRASSKRKKK